MRTSALITSIVAILISTNAYASPTVSVVLESSEPLKGVHGMLVGTEGVEEVESVEQNILSDGSIEVKVPVAYDVPDEVLVGALGRKESGDLVFSPLRSARTKGTSAPLALPDCEKESVPAINKQVPLSEQLSLLESIVHVRQEKISQTKKLLSQRLSGKLLERAQALEQSFGFALGRAPLTADLPATELAERISTLNSAIKRYHQSNDAQANTSR